MDRELKKFIQVIQEKRVKVDAILECIGDGLSVQDRDFKIIYQNTALKNLLGNHIGEYCYKAYQNNDSVCDNCQVEKVFQDGEIHRAERAVHNRDGVFYVANTASPIKDDSGEIIGSVDIVRDITVYKKSEKRISKLNQLNEQLLISGNLEDKLKLISDKVTERFQSDFTRIWLTKPGDICDSGCVHALTVNGGHVCKNHDMCLHLISSSGRYTHIDGGHKRVPYGCYKIGRIASEEDPKFVTNDVTHDPRVHDHEWASKHGLNSFAGYRLLSSSGKTTGVLALFSKNKITPEEDALLEAIASSTAQVIQTERAIAKLKARETFFNDIVEKLPFPVIVGAADYQTEYINPKFTEIFGYTIEDISDQKAWREKLFPDPAYKAKISREVDNWIAEGETDVTFERCYTDKWGREHDVEVHVLKIMERFYNIINDITDRKRAEEELRQHEKMQGVLELAGAVCHELNQPIQAISGYSQLVMMNLEDDDNKLNDKIKSIKQQIDRMGEITKKLMRITKYETTDYLNGKIIDIDKATK